MSKVVPPHGGKLFPRLLKGEELVEARERARKLPKVHMTSRETSDLIMVGIGAFSPVGGFMGKEDWKGICETFKMRDGTFWPIPITLSIPEQEASGLSEGDEVALVDEESGELMGSMKIEEKYTVDKRYECKQVFRTDDQKHPGERARLSRSISGPLRTAPGDSDHIRGTGLAHHRGPPTAQSHASIP